MLNLKLIMYLFAIIFAIVLPLALMVCWKKRTGEKVWPFIAGAIVWLLFVIIFERIAGQLITTYINSFSLFLGKYPIAFGIYAGLMAGIFEETGRLFAFKVLLKHHSEKECSVAYGIGHGGIEVLVILVPSYITYLLFEAGALKGLDSQTIVAVEAAAKSIGASTVAIALCERIVAMAIHIGLSILVFVAVNEAKHFYWYPVAIILHALVDLPAGLYQVGKASVMVVELWALFMAAIILIIGISQYKKTNKQENDAIV